MVRSLEYGVKILGIGHWIPKAYFFGMGFQVFSLHQLKSKA
jgi:hypothetical protein